MCTDAIKWEFIACTWKVVKCTLFIISNKTKKYCNWCHLHALCVSKHYKVMTNKLPTRRTHSGKSVCMCCFISIKYQNRWNQRKNKQKRKWKIFTTNENEKNANLNAKLSTKIEFFVNFKRDIFRKQIKGNQTIQYWSNGLLILLLFKNGCGLFSSIVLCNKTHELNNLLDLKISAVLRVHVRIAALPFGSRSWYILFCVC